MGPIPPRRPHRTRGPQSSASNSADQWSHVAGWYDAHVGPEGSEYQQKVIFPGVLRLLRLTGRGAKRETPLRVLDLACGQGALCRRLARAGCRVTGVDRSAPLIEAAHNYSSDPELIRYLVADVTNLAIDEELPASSMDAVTLIMAAQNLSPLSAVWHLVHELLVPSGALIVVMMHPCFRIPQQSDWVWDEERGRQSRRVDSYLTSTQIDIEVHPSQSIHGKSPRTTHHHRPLQAYVNTLGNAGLLIDRIEEWTSHKTSQPGRKQVELDRSRKEIPLFLALRALKTNLSAE